MIEESQVHIGDKVVFKHHQHRTKPEYWQVFTVTKVTTTGQITAMDNEQTIHRFNRDGFEIGGTTSYGGSKSSISAVTPEILARITYAQNIKFLSVYDYSKLSGETAQEIVSLIKAHTQQKP